MNIYSLPHEVTDLQYRGRYAEGVLIRLTGGQMCAYRPLADSDGYCDAAYMPGRARRAWLAYCGTLGYYVPEVLQ